MDRHSRGAYRCWFAVFPFGARQTFCSIALRTDGANTDRSTYPLSQIQRRLCFDGGVCLRVIARPWGSDAAGVRVAGGPNDCRHQNDSDSEYQNSLISGVARGVSLPSGGALSGDSHLAFLLRAWMAEYRSPVSVANTSLTATLFNELFRWLHFALRDLAIW